MCVCVAVPLELQSFTLSNSGVTSLQASWKKPPGDVDSYALTLLRDRCVQWGGVTVTYTHAGRRRECNEAAVSTAWRFTTTAFRRVLLLSCWLV